MIVAKEELHEIMRGKLDEIVYPYSPPAVGSVHGVQAGVGKPARCYVLVEDVWPLKGGGHAVRFRLHHTEAPRRFLRRGGGYTDDVSYAIKDPDVGVEPEALPAEDMAWIRAQSKVAAQLDRESRRRTQEQMSIELQVIELQDEAARRRIPMRDEFRLLDKMLKDGRDVSTALVNVKAKLDRDLDQAA